MPLFEFLETLYPFLHYQYRPSIIATILLLACLVRTLCMDGHGSGSRTSYYSNAGDRRLEIVSGKSYGSSNSNGTYYAKPRSPEPAAVPTHATRVSKPWSFNDSETKRKKRVASYKAYAVEGKVKATLRKGLRWIKKKCSKIVHGY